MMTLSVGHLLALPPLVLSKPPSFPINAYSHSLIRGRVDVVINKVYMPSNTKYLNGTTSQLVKTGAGTFYGVIVNSNTNGTFKLWDQTTAAVPVLLNTFTPTTATSQVYLFPMGVSFNTGLFITVGGTIDYTVLYF